MPEAERLPDIETPRSVADNPEAFELMRVWWTGEQTEMVFRPAFEDPRAFGFILAEASRHLAQVYGARWGVDPDEAHRQILEGWGHGQSVGMVTRMENTTG